MRIANPIPSKYNDFIRGVSRSDAPILYDPYKKHSYTLRNVLLGSTARTYYQLLYVDGVLVAYVNVWPRMSSETVFFGVRPYSQIGASFSWVPLHEKRPYSQGGLAIVDPATNMISSEGFDPAYPSSGRSTGSAAMIINSSNLSEQLRLLPDERFLEHARGSGKESDFSMIHDDDAVKLAALLQNPALATFIKIKDIRPQLQVFALANPAAEKIAGEDFEAGELDPILWALYADMHCPKTVESVERLMPIARSYHSRKDSAVMTWLAEQCIPEIFDNVDDLNTLRFSPRTIDSLVSALSPTTSTDVFRVYAHLPYCGRLALKKLVLRAKEHPIWHSLDTLKILLEENRTIPRVEILSLFL